MTVSFYYMNGLGNQFNIFDLRDNNHMDISDVQHFCSQYSIDSKFDQLILIYDSLKSDAAIKIYNSDYSEAKACGNATRCVGKILTDDLSKDIVTIETVNRTLIVKKVNDLFQVNMGRALTNWQDIPLSQEVNDIPLLDRNIFSTGYTVNIGNPHIVFFVDDIDIINLKKDVSFIEKHSLFPEGINVNIVKIIDDSTIKIKTWERGSGITLACGSGACASFYIAYINGFIGNTARVILSGGDLHISLSEENEILMLGDANIDLIKKY
jgi:diaminopimelate epimerase